ncbi:hypothetical protein OHA70_17220 [Kribbella sp. NBC_00382]|uniref:hypothetical protein n=1 Tax=Kribbella sp. NBC_00382 TaxID=2975967 RepID=UPI002E1D785E
MRRLLRWVFLIGPCRLYILGELNGGVVPVAALAVMVAFMAVSGGVGALVAVLTGGKVGDALFNWGLGGLLVLLGWLVYSLLLYAVLWIAGRSPLTVAGLDDGESHARHAAGTGDSHWRRRGRDPLVPLSLAGFFLLMVGFLLVGSTVTAVQERKYGGEKVVVAGDVLRYDDGPGGFGKRHLVVRYPVGDELITGDVLADDLDLDRDVPRPGQQVDVEYLVADPHQVRPAGATKRVADDVAQDRLISGICGGLAVLCGGAWLVGRWRRRG